MWLIICRRKAGEESIKAVVGTFPPEFSCPEQVNQATGEMQIAKFVLVAALAICATQCQAAEYPYSADRVDLRLLLENGAAIAKTAFKCLNEGLDKVKPNVDKILNELAPEARNYIRKYIDEARKKLKEEENRINHIFDTLLKALDRLKPIKSCYDKVSPNAKKLALSYEKQIVAIFQGAEKKFEKEIANVKLGVDKTIQRARKLFDQEVEAVIACLKPGRKDANDCVQKEIKKILTETQAILVEAVTLSKTANETFTNVLAEIVTKLLPLIDKFEKEGLVLLKELTDCVSALKAV